MIISSIVKTNVRFEKRPAMAAALLRKPALQISGSKMVTAKIHVMRATTVDARIKHRCIRERRMRLRSHAFIIIRGYRKLGRFAPIP